jgi:hypothetical protein
LYLIKIKQAIAEINQFKKTCGAHSCSGPMQDHSIDRFSHNRTPPSLFSLECIVRKLLYLTGTASLILMKPFFFAPAHTQTYATGLKNILVGQLALLLGAD